MSQVFLTLGTIACVLALLVVSEFSSSDAAGICPEHYHIKLFRACISDETGKANALIIMPGPKEQGSSSYTLSCSDHMSLGSLPVCAHD